MTPEQFVYWLQGFFEISEARKLDEKQVLIVKDHLKEVFNKKTPNRASNNPNEFLVNLKESEETFKVNPNIEPGIPFIESPNPSFSPFTVPTITCTSGTEISIPALVDEDSVGNRRYC